VRCQRVHLVLPGLVAALEHALESLDRREKVGNRERFLVSLRRIAGLFDEDLTGIGPILPLLQQVQTFHTRA
jgi:hypothetical protein